MPSDWCVCEGVISFFAVSVLRMVSESQRLWPLEPRQLKPSCKTFTPSMSNTSQEPPRALPLALHGIWSRKHAFPFSAHRPSKTTSAKVRRWHSRCSPCLIPNDLPLSLSRSRTGWNVGRTRCPNWILQTYWCVCVWNIWIDVELLPVDAGFHCLVYFNAFNSCWFCNLTNCCFIST